MLYDGSIAVTLKYTQSRVWSLRLYCAHDVYNLSVSTGIDILLSTKSLSHLNVGIGAGSVKSTTKEMSPQLK